MINGYCVNIWSPTGDEIIRLSPSSDLLCFICWCLDIYSCRWFFKVHIPLEAFLALIFQWCNQLYQIFSYYQEMPLDHSNLLSIFLYQQIFYHLFSKRNSLHFSTRQKTSLTLKVVWKRLVFLVLIGGWERGFPQPWTTFVNSLKKSGSFLLKRMRRKGVAATASSCSRLRNFTNECKRKRMHVWHMLKKAKWLALHPPKQTLKMFSFWRSNIYSLTTKCRYHHFAKGMLIESNIPSSIY